MARYTPEQLSRRDASPWTRVQITADLSAAEQDIATVLARCALRPANRILEIGCGQGCYSTALAQQGLRRVPSVNAHAARVMAVAPSMDAALTGRSG